MKTIYYTASSLDGFIADSNNSLDWLFQFGNPEENTFNHFLSGIGAIAMGSTTYQWIYDHHIADAADQPQSWPYQIPAWVFTTRASVALGSGAPLFPRAVHPPLQLQAVKRMGSSFVELHYQVPSSQGNLDRTQKP